MSEKIELAEKELKRLRGLFQGFADLDGQEDMTDSKFAWTVLHVVKEELSFPVRNLR